MTQGKPRVIKDYDKLDAGILEQIKLIYPYGFMDNLITFTNKDGKLVSALPFETDEKYYMIRMTAEEAEIIIDQDDDYDDDGVLKTEIKEVYEDKYAEIEEVTETIGEDMEEVDIEDVEDDIAEIENDEDDDEEDD